MLIISKVIKSDPFRENGSHIIIPHYVTIGKQLMDNGEVLYSAVLHKILRHCALHIHAASHDDDDDDDVYWYSAVTLCYCSMLGALGRVVSVEACCQWALLSVQITIQTAPCYLNLLYRSTLIILSVKYPRSIFSCFSHPPNSVMDYTIFNVRTRSFL